MKPGELVKLVSHVYPRRIYVAFFDVPKQGVFDNGTHALFLGKHLWPNESLSISGKQKFKILIEGRLGWIYESECKVIDETR